MKNTLELYRMGVRDLVSFTNIVVFAIMFIIASVEGIVFFKDLKKDFEYKLYLALPLGVLYTLSLFFLFSIVYLLIRFIAIASF